MNGGMVNTLKQMNDFLKEFTAYEEALALKELGFVGKCLYHYKKHTTENKHSSFPTFDIRQPYGQNHNDLPSRVSTPTYSQSFNFFREKGYENWISHNEEGYQFVIKWQFEHYGGIEGLCKINSYKEAELACLRKLIELVKNENTNSTNS